MDWQYNTLHYAARQGSFTICKQMLEAGLVNVNSPTKDGTTCLHRAAAKGHKQIVALLLKHGANVSASNKDGMTPLHMAAKKNQTEICKLLLSRDPMLKRCRDRHAKFPCDYLEMNSPHELFTMLRPM